jgi:hypothetical protein
MAIKKKTSTNIVSKTFVGLFKRFHLTIFFIFIIACLSGAVVLINDILNNNAEDPNYTSSISAGSIDQNTLNRIQSLHTSSGAPTPEVPAGRINPFSE